MNKCIVSVIVEKKVEGRSVTGRHDYNGQVKCEKQFQLAEPKG